MDQKRWKTKNMMIIDDDWWLLMIVANEADEFFIANHFTILEFQGQGSAFHLANAVISVHWRIDGHSHVQFHLQSVSS